MMKLLCATVFACCAALPASAWDACHGVTAPASLQQVNAVRQRGADCGRRGRFAAAGPLVWSPLLEGLARSQALWLVDEAALMHTGRDGSTLGQRAAAAGYHFARIAEDLAHGQADVPDVLAAWTGSDGHCANLYDAAVNEMALACLPGADGRAYWVLVLGRPL